MIRRTYRTILSITLCLLGFSSVFSQSDPYTFSDSTLSTKVFGSLSEVLTHTKTQSITLQNNTVRMDQARKAKLAAVLGTIDLNGSLLSAQFTNNTKLGVNLFPAEIFGGDPGTFREVQMGVQYNTNLTNYAEMKVVNPSGWANLKLSKINIALTHSNNQLTVKTLHENIAANYYNIINLQAQIESSRQNLAVADTLYQITQNKFQEGLVNQQDVNESKINYLNTQESISQLNFLLEQQYISLKILCDIPDQQKIEIRPYTGLSKTFSVPTVALNKTELNNAILKEEYAQANFNSTKAAFLPTISFQLSNSNNLYNTEFQPLSGNWINSNYIGLNLNIPIPGSQRITQKYNAQYEYKLAQNQTKQARIQAGLDQKTLESEYGKAISQATTDKEILALRKDSFYKNQQLYKEGIISLDIVMNSFNAMVGAQYNLIASEVDIQLVSSKISIHNQN